jgi:L-fucose mutarotase/ribose pyranase (RbsD/FucU family)
MPALKGVPSNISPDLMHVLMSMGHGDEIGMEKELPNFF